MPEGFAILPEVIAGHLLEEGLERIVIAGDVFLLNDADGVEPVEVPVGKKQTIKNITHHEIVPRVLIALVFCEEDAIEAGSEGAGGIEVPDQHFVRVFAEGWRDRRQLGMSG